MTLGVYLARLAAYEGKNVTWLPSYGAEKRGGFSFCNLVVSDEEIFSPVVETPDTLIVFDQRALETYFPKANEKTLIIENVSLILNDIARRNNKILIPASEMAKNLSALKVTNILIAGAYIAAKGLFKPENAEIVMMDMLGKKAGEMIEKNVAAFKEGFDFVKNLAAKK